MKLHRQTTRKYCADGTRRHCSVALQIIELAMLPLDQNARGLRPHRPINFSCETKEVKCPFALPCRLAPASLSPGLFPCLNTPSGISKPGLRALRISRAGARDGAVLSTYISRWSWGSSSATANKNGNQTIKAVSRVPSQLLARLR